LKTSPSWGEVLFYAFQVLDTKGLRNLQKARLYKIDIPDLNENDVVKAVGISDPSTELRIPAGLSFLVVNNDRLILLSEATIFELKKITD